VFPEAPQGDIDLGVADGVALGPDGTTLAVGDAEGVVRFVDLREGTAATAAGRHDGAVTGAQFSADGDFLVTLGDDANAIVWDVARRAAGERLEGHAGRVLAAALDERATTLHTAGLDSSVITWDLVGDRRLGRPFDLGRGIGQEGAGYPATAISRDGRTLVTDQGRGRLSLIDTSRLTPRGLTIAGSESAVNAPAFVAGGRVAVAGYEGFLALVDPRTGRIERRLRGHRDIVFTPQTSVDGSVLATTGYDATLRLWDARTGRPLGRPTRLDGPPGGHAELSPDGRTVAVPLERGTIDVYDVSSRRRLARVSVDGGAVRAAGISPDGRLLTGGSADGRIRVFSMKDWRPLAPAFQAHTGFVFGVEVSPDGRRLLTSGTDGQVRLWDRETQRPIGAPLPGPRNVIAVAFFAPGGDHAYALFANGRGYRWDVRSRAWDVHACAVAGRQLTRAEWAGVLPERDYAPAC
jgi:WD40 repeat protein